MDKLIPDKTPTPSKEIEFRITMLEASISSLTACGQATTDLRLELAKLRLSSKGFSQRRLEE
jgi:hypothetical protein